MAALLPGKTWKGEQETLPTPPFAPLKGFRGVQHAERAWMYLGKCDEAEGSRLDAEAGTWGPVRTRQRDGNIARALNSPGL